MFEGVCLLRSVYLDVLFSAFPNRIPSHSEFAEESNVELDRS